MPHLSVSGGCDGCEDARRQQLLAMRRVRGRLERVALLRASGREPPVELERRRLARELHELVAALDRRVSRLERADELSIARDAAMLRAMAVERLAVLQELEPLGEIGADAPSKELAREDDCP
jgi:hypothetical protein